MPGKPLADEEVGYTIVVLPSQIITLNNLSGVCPGLDDTIGDSGTGSSLSRAQAAGTVLSCDGAWSPEGQAQSEQAQASCCQLQVLEQRGVKLTQLWCGARYLCLCPSAE